MLKNPLLCVVATLLLSFCFVHPLRASGGICCVSCGGILICGAAVSTDCGECSVSPRVDIVGPETPSLNRSLDLKVSLGKDKLQEYKISGLDEITIKDEKSGASYSVQPRKTGNSSEPSVLDIKRVYSFLGFQLSVDSGSINLNRLAQSDNGRKLGPISIVSAEYQHMDKKPEGGSSHE